MATTNLSFASADQHLAWLDQHAALPAGFRCGNQSFDFVAEVTGKAASMTLNVIALDHATTSYAAMFTRNAFPGAPVIVGRQRLAAGEPLQAVVINNKISNVCAPDGVAAAEKVCTAVAAELGCQAQQVLPSSTG